MSEPLTMSAEWEAEIRAYVERMKPFIVDGSGPDMRETLLKELDAERAAHKRTQEALADLETRLALTKSSRDWNKEQLRHSREVSTALLSVLKPFADAWNEFEFEPLDGKPNAKDRINGELDCSLDIQIKHWRAAAIALAERDSNVTEESK